MSDDTDEARLVACALDGEREAFAVLVRRLTPLAHRTAVLLGAGADAEDVVQEAFVKAYRSLGRMRPDTPLTPWLLRIVANETHNAHRGGRRRRAREERPDAWPAAPPDDPELSAERHEQQRTLHRHLRDLPANAREVVVCRYLLDLDEAETADVLGLPRGTVKSRLHRGLARLRQVIPAEEEVDHGR